MAKIDKNTLKNWFRNKLKPRQEQFWAWMDSYWHKDEKIDVSSIGGLDELLGGTATMEQVDAFMERLDRLEDLGWKGLQDGETQYLIANRPKFYTLPENSKLYALELQGDGELEVGTGEGNIGDLGVIRGSTNGRILSFGLLSISGIWLRSSKNLEVTPIIYIKKKDNAIEFQAGLNILKFMSEGGEQLVNIISKKNGKVADYGIDNGADWINVEKRKNGLRIVINKNNDKMRTGTIVLRQQGSGKTITITVRQVECVDGSIALAYTDTNLNGKYDKCLMTLTTTKDVVTPSGWAKAGVRKYTKEVTANGTQTVTVRTAEGATKELRADVSRIGDNSGLGLVVPAITDMQADRYTIHPTGGTGTYTYKWSITGCYDITTTTAKVVGIRCKPNGICESGVLTVVVSDGQNTIARNLTIAKSCTDTVKPNISVSWGKTEGLAAMEAVTLAITASDNITPARDLVYATTSQNPEVVITNGNTASPTVKLGRFGDTATIKVRVTDEAGNYTELQQEYRTRAAITTYEFAANPETVNIPCEGGTKTVAIISKGMKEGEAPLDPAMWHIESKPDWIRVESAAGRELVFSAAKNE